MVTLIAMAPLAWPKSHFGAEDREGKWDLSLAAIYLSSESVSGDSEPGQRGSIEDDWGFRINVGYNFTNHL
jgi:hypothetical protein